MRSIAITGSMNHIKKTSQSLTDIVEWDELNCKISRMKLLTSNQHIMLQSMKLKVGQKKRQRGRSIQKKKILF